jgi:predicted Zn-dependent protease
MRRSCGLLLAAALLAACAPLSVSEEQRLGYQFEHEMRRELRFVHDRVVAGYVRDMGEEIVRAAGPQPFEYRFYVVADEEINAFAGPAGHVYVHTQTILRARNASELAGVLAHEVGHVAKRHIAHNYNRQRSAGIGRNLLVLGGAVLGGAAGANAASLGGGLAAMAYLNSFGREAEMEADAFAVEVLPKAGYDPEGLLSFFELLQREERAQGPSFLSSHPATADRIQATRAAIDALPPHEGLRTRDGSKFEIIQRRVFLLMGGSGS